MSERPQAVIRQQPEDFVVEEIPAYLPSGQGGHAFITFRKRGMTTPEAVRRIARELGIDPREAGTAGLKDKHALTTQTASFPLPLDRDIEQVVGAVELPQIEILGAARHEHKLRTGHLRGNRFSITLRGLDPGTAAPLVAQLEALGDEGLPNAFGPQRFGRDGANATRAAAWIAGRAPAPRSRTERRLLFSAWQSWLFNRVLERRVADGSWQAVLPGDLAKKRDTGGLFLVPSEGEQLEDARRRAEAGALGPTGPLFGPKMRWPGGRPGELERETLAEALGDGPGLDRFGRLGPGTRRALRLWATELRCELGSDRDRLTVSFVLPKGGYATTVLEQVCDLRDVHKEQGA